jgi:hypothetical protein
MTIACIRMACAAQPQMSTLPSATVYVPIEACGIADGAAQLFPTFAEQP